MIGQVAWTFAERGVNVIASTHAQLDVTDAEKVLETIIKVDPGVVVHCAAMTNVDVCESDPDRAFAPVRPGDEDMLVELMEGRCIDRRRRLWQCIRINCARSPPCAPRP